QQAAVVRRHTFSDPQTARGWRLGEVEGAELNRAKSLHVEEMEVFMCFEPEARPSRRRGGGGTIGARSGLRQHGREIRVAMLEPAATGAKQQQEHVFLVRQEAPEAVALLDERPQIARRAIAVPPIGVAGADDEVLLARHLKATDA